MSYSLIDFLHILHQVTFTCQETRIAADQREGLRCEQATTLPVLVVPGQVQVDRHQQQVQQQDEYSDQ